MSKIRVGVFFGGKSVEHEVSIITALQAMAAMDRNKYEVIPIYITKDQEFYTGSYLTEMASFRDIPRALELSARVLPVAEKGRVMLLRHPRSLFASKYVGEIDVAVNAGHGSHVEDGSLQGLFEYLGIPYTGCDVASAAASMDKWTMKWLFKSAGLPVVPGIMMQKWDHFADPTASIEKIEKEIGYPVIVKPYNLGSSVGITFAPNREKLAEGLELAFELSPGVLCEKAVQNLREINCSVLGDGESARPSTLEEPVLGGDMLTYKDKYQSGGGGKTGKLGGKSGGKTGGGMSTQTRIIPADISAELTASIQEMAVKAFHAIGCGGVARIDFLMDGKTGEVYVNEINTIPGSLSFYLWEKTGLSFSGLMDELVSLALKRHRERENLSFSFETNLLSTANLGGVKGTKGKLGR